MPAEPPTNAAAYLATLSATERHHLCDLARDDRDAFHQQLKVGGLSKLGARLKVLDILLVQEDEPAEAVTDISDRSTGTASPAVDDNAFIPCASFEGPKAGYVFTLRDGHLGYHRDFGGSQYAVATAEAVTSSAFDLADATPSTPASALRADTLLQELQRRGAALPDIDRLRNYQRKGAKELDGELEDMGFELASEREHVKRLLLETAPAMAPGRAPAKVLGLAPASAPTAALSPTTVTTGGRIPARVSDAEKESWTWWIVKTERVAVRGRPSRTGKLLDVFRRQAILRVSHIIDGVPRPSERWAALHPAERPFLLGRPSEAFVLIADATLGKLLEQLPPERLRADAAAIGRSSLLDTALHPSTRAAAAVALLEPHVVADAATAEEKEVGEKVEAKATASTMAGATLTNDLASTTLPPMADPPLPAVSGMGTPVYGAAELEPGDIGYEGQALPSEDAIQ